MTQTIDATADEPNARVFLDLVWTTPSAPTTATIRRVHMTAGIVPKVRNAEPADLVAGLWSFYDYEAPLDEQFFYVVTDESQPAVIITSAVVSLASGGRTWLKHVSKPSLNTVVQVESAPDLSRPIPQGVFDVIGRSQPIVVSLPRKSSRGTLNLVSNTETERRGLWQLLQDGSPLLLLTPVGYGLGHQYISISDVEEKRVVGVGHEPTRRWELEFTVVGRPSGLILESGVTWQTVLDDYDTWLDIVITEADWQDVLEGSG